MSMQKQTQKVQENDTNGNLLEEDFQVEFVYGKKLAKGQQKFLVKWKNYSKKESTWENDDENLKQFNDHTLLRFERSNDYRTYHYNTRRKTQQNPEFKVHVHEDHIQTIKKGKQNSRSSRLNDNLQQEITDNLKKTQEINERIKQTTEKNIKKQNLSRKNPPKGQSSQKQKEQSEKQQPIIFQDDSIYMNDNSRNFSIENKSPKRDKLCDLLQEKDEFQDDINGISQNYDIDNHDENSQQQQEIQNQDLIIDEVDRPQNNGYQSLMTFIKNLKEEKVNIDLQECTEQFVESDKQIQQNGIQEEENLTSGDKSLPYVKPKIVKKDEVYHSKSKKSSLITEGVERRLTRSNKIRSPQLEETSNIERASKSSKHASRSRSKEKVQKLKSNIERISRQSKHASRSQSKEEIQKLNGELNINQQKELKKLDRLDNSHKKKHRENKVHQSKYEFNYFWPISVDVNEIIDSEYQFHIEGLLMSQIMELCKRQPIVKMNKKVGNEQSNIGWFSNDIPRKIRWHMFGITDEQEKPGVYYLIDWQKRQSGYKPGNIFISQWDLLQNAPKLYYDYNSLFTLMMPRGLLSQEQI